jgi:DNA-binding transcriptional MerR regulator
MLEKTLMSSKSYSTGEAAAKARITRVTLQDWIKKGKIEAPKVTKVGNVSVRLWTASDIERLKAVKQRIYQEKRRKK